MEGVFEKIYQENAWKNDESVSGAGSTEEATRVIRQELPGIFRRYRIKNVLDIPCGDFNWASEVKWPGYIGADVVPELIMRNREEWPEVDFRVLDVTKDFLPEVDLILCRDLLGHFSNYFVQKALRNIVSSGSRYLLATTFPKHENNGDIWTGDWRPINLASYYGLPDPIAIFNEGCTAGGGQFADKSLGVWRLDNE